LVKIPVGAAAAAAELKVSRVAETALINSTA
jgi:hypothetical protein